VELVGLLAISTSLVDIIFRDREALLVERPTNLPTLDVS